LTSAPGRCRLIETCSGVETVDRREALRERRSSGPVILLESSFGQTSAIGFR